LSHLRLNDVAGLNNTPSTFFFLLSAYFLCNFLGKVDTGVLREQKCGIDCCFPL